MLTSTIDEAQSRLVQLIGLAEKGEEIIIARATVEGLTIATRDANIQRYPVLQLLA